ncbi:hypothetical protein ACFPAG_03120 [Vogesella sp. GCM10023246]|uniref:Transposase n=1 Tax=Vogesella oryzagri TaxID=3160864 RepID=A0ABV1M2N7_9NEIS
MGNPLQDWVGDVAVWRMAAEIQPRTRQGDQRAAADSKHGRLSPVFSIKKTNRYISQPGFARKVAPHHKQTIKQMA